jgi:hypothetical protein
VEGVGVGVGGGVEGVGVGVDGGTVGVGVGVTAQTQSARSKPGPGLVGAVGLPTGRQSSSSLHTQPHFQNTY